MTFNEIKQDILEYDKANKVRGANHSVVMSSNFPQSLLFNIEGMKEEAYPRKFINDLQLISEGEVVPSFGETYGRGDIQYFANNRSNMSGMLHNKVAGSLTITINIDSSDGYSNWYDQDTNKLYYYPQSFTEENDSFLRKGPNAVAIKLGVADMFISQKNNTFIYLGENKISISNKYKNIFEINCDSSLVDIVLEIQEQYISKKVRVIKDKEQIKKNRLKGFVKGRQRANNGNRSSHNDGAKLRESTEYHEKMIEVINNFFERDGYKTYYDVEDLVAVKGDEKIIVEVKTTNSLNIEKQIRTAFAQLIFYDHEYHNQEAEKWVVISSGKPMKRTVEILNSYNISIKTIKYFESA